MECTNPLRQPSQTTDPRPGRPSAIRKSSPGGKLDPTRCRAPSSSGREVRHQSFDGVYLPPTPQTERDHVARAEFRTEKLPHPSDSRPPFAGAHESNPPPIPQCGIHQKFLARLKLCGRFLLSNAAHSVRLECGSVNENEVRRRVESALRTDRYFPAIGHRAISAVARDCLSPFSAHIHWRPRSPGRLLVSFCVRFARCELPVFSPDPRTIIVRPPDGWLPT
jgi:hypothetical protein